MRTPSMCSTMPSETLTSCWTTSGVHSVALGARPTLKALIARRRSAIWWTANDDGVSISGNALNQCDADHDLRYWPWRDHCAHGFRSTASTLLNEEGAFDGDVVEAQLGHDTEKKSASGTTRWCGASLEGATRTRSAASVTVRPIGSNARV